MKRLAFIGIALALVCTTFASASLSGVNRTVAIRKSAAKMSAQKLLNEFLPPRDAHRITGLSGSDATTDYGDLSGWNSAPIGEYSSVHRFWVSHSKLTSLKPFVRAHLPAGFRPNGSEEGGAFVGLGFSRLSHGVEKEILDVTMVRRPGNRTLVRADARVLWIYPRSPQEVVPAGVRTIDIKAPHVTRRVTDPAQVHQIIHWFDRLPVVPPNTGWHECGPTSPALYTLAFRSANGVRVASATAPIRPFWDLCGLFDFKIHGKGQPTLVDSPRGASFQTRLEHLLGVKIR